MPSGLSINTVDIGPADNNNDDSPMTNSQSSAGGPPAPPEGSQEPVNPGEGGLQIPQPPGDRKEPPPGSNDPPADLGGIENPNPSPEGDVPGEQVFQDVPQDAPPPRDSPVRDQNVPVPPPPGFTDAVQPDSEGLTTLRKRSTMVHPPGHITQLTNPTEVFVYFIHHTLGITNRAEPLREWLIFHRFLDVDSLAIAQPSVFSRVQYMAIDWVKTVRQGTTVFKNVQERLDAPSVDKLRLIRDFIRWTYAVTGTKEVVWQLVTADFFQSFVENVSPFISDPNDADEEGVALGKAMGQTHIYPVFLPYRNSLQLADLHETHLRRQEELRVFGVTYQQWIESGRQGNEPVKPMMQVVNMESPDGTPDTYSPATFHDPDRRLTPDSVARLIERATQFEKNIDDVLRDLERLAVRQHPNQAREGSDDTSSIITMASRLTGDMEAIIQGNMAIRNMLSAKLSANEKVELSPDEVSELTQLSKSVFTPSQRALKFWYNLTRTKASDPVQRFANPNSRVEEVPLTEPRLPRGSFRNAASNASAARASTRSNLGRGLPPTNVPPRFPDPDPARQSSSSVRTDPSGNVAPRDEHQDDGLGGWNPFKSQRTDLRNPASRAIFEGSRVRTPGRPLFGRGNRGTQGIQPPDRNLNFPQRTDPTHDRQDPGQGVNVLRETATRAALRAQEQAYEERKQNRVSFSDRVGYTQAPDQEGTTATYEMGGQTFVQPNVSRPSPPTSYNRPRENRPAYPSGPGVHPTHSSFFGMADPNYQYETQPPAREQTQNGPADYGLSQNTAPYHQTSAHPGGSYGFGGGYSPVDTPQQGFGTSQSQGFGFFGGTNPPQQPGPDPQGPNVTQGNGFGGFGGGSNGGFNGGFSGGPGGTPPFYPSGNQAQPNPQWPGGTPPPFAGAGGSGGGNGGGGSQPGRSNNDTPDRRVADFIKGIKRDKDHYMELKYDSQFDEWSVSVLSTARVHGVIDVLRVSYIPKTRAEIRLFYMQQAFLYDVFQHKVKTITGRKLIMEQRYDADARYVWVGLIHHANNSTAGRQNAASIMRYLFTARDKLATWRGSTYDFLLTFQKQVAKYNEMVPMPKRLHDDIVLGLIQEAVRPVESLANIQGHAEVAETNGNLPLNYPQYMDLLYSAAQRHDESHGLARNRRVNTMLIEQLGEEDEPPEDPTVAESTPVSMLDINATGITRRPGTNSRSPRMDLVTWQKLPKESQVLWDKLDDDSKRTILNYAKARQDRNQESDRSSNSTDVIPTVTPSDSTETESSSPTSEENSTEILAMVTNQNPNPGDVRRVLSQANSSQSTSSRPCGTLQANVHVTVGYSVSRSSTLSVLASLIDRGANGGVANGADCRIISKTSRMVDVTGVGNHQLTNKPVVTMGAVVETDKGPVIIICHEYALIPEGKSIHSCLQLEAFGNDVNDKSSKVPGGKQRILTPDGYLIPLDIDNGLPYLKMRPYTDVEWDELPHIILTSDTVWDPSIMDHRIDNIQEWANQQDEPPPLTMANFDEFGNYRRRTIQEHYQPRAEKMIPLEVHEGQRVSGGGKSTTKSEEDYELLRKYFLMASADTIERTYKATTQYGRDDVSSMTLQKTYKSHNPAFNVWRRHEAVATDTVKASVPAVDCGHRFAQIFVGRDTYVIDVYGVKTDGEFVNTLEDNIRRRGAMDKLISDSARSESSTRVKDILRALFIGDWQSEPYYQHQNFAERRYQTLKTCTNRVMNKTKARGALWLLCMAYVAYLLNHMALESLGWRTPLEALTGQTPDISAITKYEFNEPIYYRTHEPSFPSENTERLGYFVGYAENVGNAFTYKVLDAVTDKIIHRSAVRTALDPDTKNSKVEELGFKEDTVDDKKETADIKAEFEPKKAQRRRNATPKVLSAKKRNQRRASRRSPRIAQAPDNLEDVDPVFEPEFITDAYPGLGPLSKESTLHTLKKINPQEMGSKVEGLEEAPPTSFYSQVHSTFITPRETKEKAVAGSDNGESVGVETVQDENAYDPPNTQDDPPDPPKPPGPENGEQCMGDEQYIFSKREYASQSGRPMLTIEPDDFVGRSFLASKNPDGTRDRARIVELIRDHEDKVASQPELIKFRCSRNDGELEEIITYRQLLDHLDGDDRNDGTWRFRSIHAHQGPLRPENRDYKGSSYNVQVEWETGEITYEPLDEFYKTDPVTTSLYAKDQGLLDTDGWKRCRSIARRETKLLRMVHQATLKSFRSTPVYKFGYLIPRSFEQGLEIDRKNGNNKWREANDKEISQIMEFNTFNDRGRGDLKPDGYKKIRVHMVYDVKHDGRHKARLVAGGHLTEIPVESVYSSVVSLRGIRIVTFLAELNGLELWSTDISCAYLQAKTKEKIYIVAGPEFGALQGHTLIVNKSLYGLRSSGLRWHDLASDVLRDIGFTPSLAEDDIWMRDMGDHYEYICVYVDDLLIASKSPKSIIEALEKVYNFQLKGTGPVSYHLGLDFARDEHNVMTLTPKKYIDRLLEGYERMFGSKPKQNVSSPLEKGDHPELDDSKELDPEDIRKYQSMIGALQWLVSLGRMDIATSVMTMSSFRAAPRVGHLERLKRIYGYVSKMRHGALRVRTDLPDYSDLPIPIYEWEYSVYGEVTEVIPEGIPTPKGKPVTHTTYVDANLYHDLLTGRAVTGILHLFNKFPIDFFTKKQATVETATYGSEFVAARIATEQIMDLRLTLRYLGVPIQGTTYMFGDNEAVVKSSSIMKSRLHKRHNALSYHRVREAIAAGIVGFFHIPSGLNPADILTKPWGYGQVWDLLQPLMFWKGDTADLLDKQKQD